MLKLLNRCIDAVGSGGQVEEIGGILEELLEYIDDHFRREEVIMAACNYPRLSSHQQGHRAMVEKVSQRINEFAMEQLSAKSLLLFLRSWFTSHVINQEQDREIASCCQGKLSAIAKALADAGLNHLADGHE